MARQPTDDRPRKRAPCVDMRTDVHKDTRFECLAQIAGFPGGKYEAIGRMHALWSWCVDRVLKDAPETSDGYVVSVGVVRQFLGQSGEMALIAEGCDELALGVRLPDNRYYLKGTSEYVAARRQLVKTAHAGGLARGNSPRVNGRYVVDTTFVQPATSPDSSQDTSREPAATSVLPSSSYLKEENVELRLTPPCPPEPRKPKAESPEPSGDHALVVSAFDAQFRSAYGSAPSWGQRQGGQVKTLLKTHSRAEIIRRIGVLFDSPPSWLSGPYDFGTLVQHFDKLVCAEVKPITPSQIRKIPQL